LLDDASCLIGKPLQPQDARLKVVGSDPLIELDRTIRGCCAKAA
jgi:hypothetical protein